MDLSGRQRRQLQEALVDAFPTKSSLEQMLSFELDKKLAVIVGEGSLLEIIFNLITKAETEEWIEELIVAARRTNPGNKKLLAIKLTPVSELSSRNHIQQSGEPNKNRFQIGRRGLEVNIGNIFTLLIVTIFVLIAIRIYYENKSSETKNINYQKEKPIQTINYQKEKPIQTINYQKENGIKISNLIVAEKDKYQRIEISAYNPLKRDISVNHLKIKREYQGIISCEVIDEPLYIFSDTIYISKFNRYNRFTLPIFPKTGALSGTKYLAKGSQTDSCDNSYLELSFDTSFFLKANSYTIFLIDIPKELKVSQAKFVVSGKSINAKTLKTEMTPESVKGKSISLFKIDISISTDIQQEISFTKNFTLLDSPTEQTHLN